MPYSHAVDDVRATSALKGREAVAVTWAESLAATDFSEPLKILFRSPAVGQCDVGAYCRTLRARNLLHNNELTELAQLLELSVRDLWTIRQCGHESVVDILAAMLMALAEMEPADDTADQSLLEGTEASLPSADSPIALLEEWVTGLDERQIAILQHRIAARDRTLDDLGVEFRVSRERIRQVELSLTNRLKILDTTPLFERLKDQVGAAIGRVIPEARLIEVLPDLNRQLANTHLRVIDLLPALTGLDRDSGWIADGALTNLRDETFRVAVSDRGYPPAPKTLEEHRLAIGLKADEWSDWLEYCDLRQVGSTVVRQGATIPELALAALHEAQHPLTAEEIADLTGVVSVQSLRNRLQEDERFARVGPNSYGLPAWGVETYEGIREEIVQRIERSGGRARLSSVIADLVEQFGVSGSSVSIYASGREFVRRDGWISLADGNASSLPRRSTRMITPAETRRCFFREGLWWFRIDVTKDTLRGSGLMAPKGAMAIFQVAQGTERTFQLLGQEVRISWTRIQPAFGTIRTALLQLDAREGDVVWLTPADDNVLRIRLVRGWTRTAADRIALRCGITRDVDGEALLKGILHALALPTGTGWSSVVHTLRGRGDLDLADLAERYAPAEQEDSTPPSIDDFLDALRGR
jgi:hypothetical protein